MKFRSVSCLGTAQQMTFCSKDFFIFYIYWTKCLTENFIFCAVKHEATSPVEFSIIFFFGKVSASYCQNICGKVHLSKVLGKFFWTYLGRFVWIMKIILLESSYFRYSNNIYVASWNYKSLIAKTWKYIKLESSKFYLDMTNKN